MDVNELKTDMIDTLNLALSGGFSEYIDRHVIQNWIDDLTKIEQSQNTEYTAVKAIIEVGE